MKAKRRARLEAKAAAEEEETKKWIEKYDKDGSGSMSREEVELMLNDIKREATGDANAVVAPDILSQVISRYAGENQTIDREEVLKTVRKYKKYLAKEVADDDELAALFVRHDADKSGALGVDELLKLLRDVAPGPHKHAEEADAEFVLRRCDADGSDRKSVV